MRTFSPRCKRSETTLEAVFAVCVKDVGLAKTPEHFGRFYYQGLCRYLVTFGINCLSLIGINPLSSICQMDCGDDFITFT